MIDHYDSFTYNLVVAFEKLNASVKVFKTNARTGDVREAHPTHIVLSPGPGHPREVGFFHMMISQWEKRIPILGVCLGHQAIGQYFNEAKVDRFDQSIVMHGKTSIIEHDHTGIFRGVRSPFKACRYHSLAIIERTIDSSELRVVARSKNDGVVMAVQSVKYPHIVGVQFHPESLFTEHGPVLLRNFLKMKVGSD